MPKSLKKQLLLIDNHGDSLIKNHFSIENKVTLFYGDCLLFMKEIPDKSIQLIVTSPPYNIGKPYEKRLELEQYIEQQRAVIEECIRILKDEGSICWEVGNYVKDGEIIPLDILLYNIFKKNGLKLRNRIVWHFGHGLHCTRRFSGRYEVILWFTKSDNYVFNLDCVRIPQKYPGKKYFKGPKIGQYSCHPLGKNPTDVWEIPNVKNNHVEKTIHPCQFPIALVQRLVLALSNEGDIIFDPFLGVGSTAVAALINGRKTAGAEILKEYYEIACDRIILALQGQLKIRPDVPVFEPKGNLSLLKDPFNNGEKNENY
ncbi:MAG: DNA-methyltransferase [Thermodesulfovibrionales bacterium]